MSALIKNNIRFDVISIDPDSECSDIEDIRTNYRWKPESLENMIDSVDNHYVFESLTDPDFQRHMDVSGYEVGIQGGGLGILKDNVISNFKLGLLNFHPGDLPAYRGSSAPEWQLFEGKEVVATCHLIDAGIDSGDIVGKKNLQLDYSDYYSMRAGIYPEMALYLVEIILQIILDNGINSLQEQDEDNSVYRNYIGDDAIEELKERMEQGDIFKHNVL